MTEFQELINTDPVVRMYVHQMIAQVPSTKPYRRRHLESVQQMIRLINEVLTMAPEFGETAMVATPLGALLDWTTGIPAGFAAFRDPRISAMLKKILTAWCEFLSSGDSVVQVPLATMQSHPRAIMASDGVGRDVGVRSRWLRAGNR